MLISTHIIIHNKFTFLFFHENDKATKVRKYINSFICYIILTFPHISVIPSKSIFSSNTTQLIKQKETFKCYRKRIFHALDRTGFFFVFFSPLSISCGYSLHFSGWETCSWGMVLSWSQATDSWPQYLCPPLSPWLGKW